MYLLCYYLGEEAGSYTHICVGLGHPWQDEKLLTVVALRLVKGENRDSRTDMLRENCLSLYISFHLIFLILCKYLLQNSTLGRLQSRAIMIPRSQEV